MSRKLRCPYCGELKELDSLVWVYDNYGIPYKQVCCDCYEKADAYIREWSFDASYVGESLYGDY